MQDVTDLAFMRLIARYGAPECFVTEYFRVHSTSRLEPHILESITRNDTGRPVIAQMIGESIPDLVRTARELARHPVHAIDLNLGCPAPKVYRKNVGGGLLREPATVDAILEALREAVPGRLTVKTRIGFEDDSRFGELLEVFARHRVDLVTVHGRTVKQMYRPGVRYEAIGRAVRAMPCPVIANGDVTSAAAAERILAETGAAGVMVGRHAIRNPWIFGQIASRRGGRPMFRPTLGDVRGYVETLHDAFVSPDVPDRVQVHRLKKFLNFVGVGVDPEGKFLHDMRRVESTAALFAVADAHLVAGGRAGAPFADEPYPGVVSRPNRGEADSEFACG